MATATTESHLTFRDLERLLRGVAGEVGRGAGFGLPVIVDVEKEEDAEALLSYLPFFLEKGTFKGQLVSDGVGSSSPTKPILVIAPSAMTLVNIQLLFRTYSFLRPSEVTGYNECKGAPFSTCALPSPCPVDVANCDVVFTHAGFFQCLPRDLFQAVIVYQSNSLEVAFNTNIVLHFQAKTILVRTQQAEPDYDGKAEAMSLHTMLRDNLQLPHTEGPIILRAGISCVCPDSEGSCGDPQQTQNFQGNEPQTAGAAQAIELKSDSTSSKDSIQVTGCPFAGPEVNGTAELHINNSATLQEVHRQSPAQQTGPAEVGQTTCQFQEDLVSLSREKKKDQLSQLVPVLNAGVMNLLRFIEREVSDANQGHPLVVDLTDEQEAIALMSFLPYVLGKGTMKEDVDTKPASKPVLIVAACASSLLKLKIMLGKESFLTGIMRCNKDGAPYSVRVVPRHASKPRDVVLAGTYHYRCLRRDFCSALILYESNSLKADVTREILMHFQSRPILIQTSQYPGESHDSLQQLCPINVRIAVQQISFSHRPATELPAAPATVTRNSKQGAACVHSVTVSPSTMSSALQLDTSKPETQEQLTRHHPSHCSRSITPSEELLLPAEPSHGVIETTSRTMHTHGSTFSSVRRNQEGSNANDGITVMPMAVQGEHVSPSDVLQEWSWKSLFCCFRRNSRNNTEAEVMQQPRKSRFSFIKSRNRSH